MSITTAQVKEIRTDFAKLKPEKITLDGNRSLTVKEAVFALAPTLERMKKRGFDTEEIARKLHGKGIVVTPPTLAKYLAEFRRKQGQKTDRPAPQKQTEKPQADAVKPMGTKPVAARAQGHAPGEFFIRPDTPKDEL
jgi:hypothetical protein